MTQVITKKLSSTDPLASSAEGPPPAAAAPSPTEARRTEQAAADDRMQALVEGGASDRRGASVVGQAPLASTTRPLALLKRDWEEHKAGIAARDKPIEFDPNGQMLLTAPLAVTFGAAHGALGIAKHLIEHVALDTGLEKVEAGVEHLHAQKHEAHEGAPPPATGGQSGPRGETKKPARPAEPRSSEQPAPNGCDVAPENLPYMCPVRG